MSAGFCVTADAALMSAGFCVTADAASMSADFCVTADAASSRHGRHGTDGHTTNRLLRKPVRTADAASMSIDFCVSLLLLRTLPR